MTTNPPEHFQFDFCSGIKGVEATSMTVFSDNLREHLLKNKISFNEIRCVYDFEPPSLINLVRGVIARYFIYPVKVIWKRKTKLLFIADSANSHIINFLPKNISTVVFIHGLAFQEDHKILNIKVDFKDRLIQIASRLLKFPGLIKTTLVMTNSKRGKSDIERLFKGRLKNKVIVAPLGVAPMFERTNVMALHQELSLNNSTKKIILTVAAPDLRKNISSLVSALKKLDQNRVNWLWIHIGGLHDSVVQKINEPLKKRLISINQVPHYRMPEYYSLADVFILPTCYDTFGWPPLEAAACGCPVITTNIEPLMTNLKEIAYFVEPNDSDELLKAIYAVLTDDGLSNEMSKKGQSIKNTFRWEETTRTVVEALYDLYTKPKTK